MYQASNRFHQHTHALGSWFLSIRLQHQGLLPLFVALNSSPRWSASRASPNSTSLMIKQFK